MSFLKSLAVTTLAGLVMMPSLSFAQERRQDTTPRKESLKIWGAQFEEFEYRYSDHGEELATWNGDFFYGTDELKFRWLTSGEYAIEEQAYEGLENQIVG